MQRGIFSNKNQTFDIDQTYWDTVIYNPSSLTCKNSVSLPTTGTNKFSKDPGLIQGLCAVRNSGQKGTSVVDREYKALQWQEPTSYRTCNDYTNRCIKKGLGGILQGSLNRGCLVKGGEVLPYQYPRNESLEVGNLDIYKGNVNESNTYTNRQQDSSCIFNENGWYTQHPSPQYKQIDLGVSVIKGDHSYSRIPTKQVECQGGLGIQECEGPLRVEITKEDFLEDSKVLWNANNRSVCIPVVSSTSLLHVLEARSNEHSSRCTTTTLGAPVRICVSSIQSHNADFKTGYEGEYT